MLETNPTPKEAWAAELEQAVAELDRNKEDWLRHWTGGPVPPRFASLSDSFRSLCMAGGN